VSEELEKATHQIKTAKKRLEEDIRSLLLDFSNETKIEIESISLLRPIESIKYYRVKVELSLE
jgi:hypothetical protein